MVNGTAARLLRRVVLAAVVVSAGILGACGRPGGTAAALSVSAACRSVPKATVAEATTASYHIALEIGLAEAVVPENHPTTTAHPTQGETLVRGQMTMLPGMIIGPATGPAAPGTAPVEDRHLEVHICSRATGQVLADAQPSITVIDNSAGGMSQQVPVAVMRGAGEGMGDLHYGNNVVMQPGHAFTVLVAVGPDQATFKVTTPSTVPGPSTAGPANSSSGGPPAGMSHG